MLVVVSRRKAALSAAACSGRRGGHSRVLEEPGRGVFAMTPIAQLEEGLLAILNGQTDKRFELDHPDLGGLAFRIDQLLNQLMGVEEDTSDAEGRISRSGTAAQMSAAILVARVEGE